jgi:hypothetical protein
MKVSGFLLAVKAKSIAVLKKAVTETGKASRRLKKCAFGGRKHTAEYRKAASGLPRSTFSNCRR